MKVDAQLLLFCFSEVAKRIAVLQAFLIIDDKTLLLLLYL